MSATKISIRKVEQVHWKFKISTSSNKVTASGAYEDDYVGWMLRMPALNSPHPEIPALRLKDIDADRQPGEKILVTLSYESNDPNADYPGREKKTIKLYSMEPGAGEEPLLTNQLFKNFTDEEKTAALELVSSSKKPEDFDTATSKLTSSAGILFLEKVRKGIEAYRNPSLVWVERFSSKSLEDVELSKILKTTSNPPGNAPSPGAERNYLRLPPSVTPNDDGESWNFENRWELSLRGKWDPDIYPPGG
jgi:hypothetical protein